MNGLNIWLAIGAGGAAGAMARHGVGLAAARIFGSSFPWGTLAVNVIGSTAMGFVIAFLAMREPNPGALRALLATGFLGGFTTFSAFAFDIVTLHRERALSIASAYIAASIVLSVGGLLIGLAMGRALS